MRRLLPISLLSALFLTLSGCGGSDSPAAPQAVNPSGGWTSVNGTARLTMTINSVNGTVSGNGQFTQGSTSIAMSITGTYVPPSISLSMSATGFQTLNFSGAVESPTRMTGTLNGSGFSNTIWIFDKQ
jgi:hypothetical protein